MCLSQHFRTASPRKLPHAIARCWTSSSRKFFPPQCRQYEKQRHWKLESSRTHDHCRHPLLQKTELDQWYCTLNAAVVSKAITTACFGIDVSEKQKRHDWKCYTHINRENILPPVFMERLHKSENSQNVFRHAECYNCPSINQYSLERTFWNNQRPEHCCKMLLSAEPIYAKFSTSKPCAGSTLNKSLLFEHQLRRSVVLLLKCYQSDVSIKKQSSSITALKNIFSATLKKSAVDLPQLLHAFQELLPVEDATSSVSFVHSALTVLQVPTVAIVESVTLAKNTQSSKIIVMIPPRNRWLPRYLTTKDLANFQSISYCNKRVGRQESFTRKSAICNGLKWIKPNI